MTTAYTSLLGLALPVTGELSGTWGTTVNDAITSLLDSAVAGTTTISADADITLTTTTGAANESREAIILWTAGGTVTRNITAPAQSKAYIVINKSSNTQSIVLRGVGPTTGVTIVLNEKAVCAWNGSDFVKVASTVITNLTGTLPVANGGTGVTTSTGSGNVVLSTSPTLVTPALGTPSALVGTNITGTASGLTAGNVTTNANLTGAVTSVGNATSLGSFTSAQLLGALTDETGTGANVFAISPALTGTPTAPTATSGTSTTQIATTAFATTAIQALYPVGSIYINASVATNPATLFGFGTWTAFGAGLVPVGFDSGNALFSTVGNTGGAANATLVSHTHTASVTDPGHAHTADQPLASSTAANGGGYYGQGNNRNTGTATTGITVGISTEGSSATNANYQPYITVYMWQRTA